MTKNRNVLDKGTYNFHQEGAFLSVKQYMLVEREGKRCLLLRFMNESNLLIQAMEFTLIQLDGDGKVISTDRMRYDDLSVRPAREYALKTGIVLKPGCVNFRVQMAYAISGEYKYVFKNGQAVEHYDPRGYDLRQSTVYRKSTLSAKRKYSGAGRLYGFIAFVGILLILAACALAVVKTQSNFGKDREHTVLSYDHIYENI